MPKRLYIETYGCQMNVSDSELMLGALGSPTTEFTRACGLSEMRGQQTERRTAVILTALGLEYSAVRAHLEDLEERTEQGTVEHAVWTGLRERARLRAGLPALETTSAAGGCAEVSRIFYKLQFSDLAFDHPCQVVTEIKIEISFIDTATCSPCVASSMGLPLFWIW